MRGRRHPPLGVASITASRASAARGEPLESRRWPRCWRDALDPGAPPDALLGRVRASLDAVATFLEARARRLDALWSAEPLRFSETEQALLLGHLLHPTPKGLSGPARARYSPELQPRFQLHWLSVDAALVEHDSATGTPAPELAARLLGRARRPAAS